MLQSHDQSAFAFRTLVKSMILENERLTRRRWTLLAPVSFPGTRAYTKCQGDWPKNGTCENLDKRRKAANRSSLPSTT